MTVVSPAVVPLANHVAQEQAPPRVALIDEYKIKDVDVDGDGVFDLTHGVLVESYLRSKLPDAVVTRYPLFIETTERRPVSGNSENNSPQQYENVTVRQSNIRAALTDINRRVDNGETIDAVNLSISETFTFRYLREMTGIDDLTNENLPQHREAVLEALHRNKPDVAAEIELMEALSQKGVRVYVSAGNDLDKLNALTLAEGRNIHRVGATDAQGRNVETFPNNPFINARQRGIFTPVPVTEGSATGYDLTADGIVDFRPEDVSGGQERFQLNSQNPGNLSEIRGTSFATPLQLGEDLNRQRQNR